ncbi:hypothetical protein K501DRAFT_185375 [Backusella circina FSU 941]|nr:hypothetical protein K501DRAFT_185375 [Backusella circina FSU 941]
MDTNNTDNTITEETTTLNDIKFVLSPFQQWEIAFIYAFITTFNPQAVINPSFYKLPNLTPEELEIEIPKKESQPVHQFICASLSNALNRKKAIESYNNAFSQIVADKYKTFDLDLDYNPLTHTKFTDLDPNVKLLLLRSLVEWQLQDSQAVKTILEHCNQHAKNGQINPIQSHPIGIDSKKRSYWQFGGKKKKGIIV